MEKTKYFDHNNIRIYSENLLNKLNTKFDLHTNHFNIDKSALLILDMQRFFFDENSHAYLPSAPAIIKPILHLVDLFLINKRPILLTKHLNTYDDAKMMGYWWRDILTEQSHYSDLIDEINNIQKTNLISKSQYDAFYKTELDAILKNLNIEQIIICGVITHLCCETTARSAFVHGYNVFFPIDGTATYNEEIHSASLINLAHGFTNITTIQNLIDNIDD